MEAFPFTDAEWDPIGDLAVAILDAHYAKDKTLTASLTLDLLDRVDTLRAVHGDHPVLLETAADYTDDPPERAELYRRAVALAEEHGLPTLSIRLAFAPVLVELGEPDAALEELRACGAEAAAGTADEQWQWSWELEHVAYESAADAGPTLYRQAMAVAAEHQRSPLRLHLLLVRFLLDAGERAAALDELGAAERELPGGDEDDRAFLAQLRDEASGTTVGGRGHEE